MKTHSIPLAIGLLAAAPAFSQTNITLAYAGYDAADSLAHAMYGATAGCGAVMPTTVTPNTAGNGFLFSFTWSCYGGKSSVSGTVGVSVSPSSVTATWPANGLMQFSPQIDMSATANVTGTANIGYVQLGPYSGFPSLTTVNPWYSLSPAICDSGRISGPGTVSQNCQLQFASDDSSPPGTLPVIALQVEIGTSDPVYGGSADWVMTAAYFKPCTTCVSSTPVFDHIDVVQVVPVDDPKTNEPMVVSNKSTVVRVFGTAPQQTTVTATLQSNRDATVLSQPLTVGPNKGDPDIDNSSANFLLPSSWVTSGGLNLTAKLQAGNAQATDSLEMLFKPPDGWPPVYRVAAIRVCEMMFPSATYLCAGSDQAPLDDLGGFLRKILPMGEYQTEYSLVGTWSLDLTELDVARLRQKLAWMYLQLAARLGPDAPDLLIAWIPHGGVLSQENQSDNTATFTKLDRAFGINQLVAVLEDSADAKTNQLYLALVTAIDLGADVAIGAPYIGVAGYDPEIGAVRPSGFRRLGVGVELDPASTWVSPNQYLSFYQAFAPSNATSSALARRAVSAASSTAYLMITGTVQADSSGGTLDAGVVSAVANSPAASNPAGNFCLHFAAGSTALGDYCFQASFQDPVTGAAVSSALFAVLAPFPSATTRVSLVSNSGANKGRELAAIDKSATAPTVQITSPHTGDTVTAGSLNITWTSASASGSSLLYNLSASADGGATWTPLDVALTGTQYTLDTTLLAGGSRVMFLVEATDGLNTASATVGPLTLTQTPQISLPATTLNYGKALLGGGADQLISIANNGTGPLTVTAITLDNSVFSLISPALPLTVNAGAQQAIDIRFVPAATGVQATILKIASSDPAHAMVTMNLTGEGIAIFVPVASLAAPSLDCGSAAVGQSATATLNIGNTGPAPLIVSAATSSNAMFSLTAPTVPFTVANHSQQAITVHFAPTATGAQLATLTLSTNDPATPTLTVHLTGTAISGGLAPQIRSGGIVNAASFTGTVARGSLATIFGANLATSTAQGLSLPWSTRLGGASLTVGGVAAPIYYASPTQINFQVPYEVPSGNSANVVVTSGGVAGSATPVALADYAVGVFTYARMTQYPVARLREV